MRYARLVAAQAQRLPVAVVVALVSGPTLGAVVLVGATMEALAGRIARRSCAEATAVVVGGLEACRLLSPVLPVRLFRGVRVGM